MSARNDGDDGDDDICDDAGRGGNAGLQKEACSSHELAFLTFTNSDDFSHSGSVRSQWEFF